MPDPGPDPGEVTVSLIAGAFRSGPYIDAFIASVRRQTRPDWELIIVDDASPDDAGERIRDHLDDPRIVALSHEVNRGCSAARNTAASRARGRYLVAVDSDDVLHEDFLDRMLAAVADVDLAVAGCWNAVVDEDGRALTVTSPPSPGPDPEGFLLDILRGPFDHGPVTLMTAERFAALGGYDDGVAFGEDFALWARAIAAGGTVVVVPEPLYSYRVHRRSTTRDPMREVRNHELLLETLDVVAGAVGADPARREALAVHRRRTARLATQARYRGAVRDRDRAAARAAATTLLALERSPRSVARWLVALFPAAHHRLRRTRP